MLAGLTVHLYQSMSIIYGPEDGKLLRQRNIMSAYTANVDVRDFTVEALFSNPRVAAAEGWDYGFIFRSTDMNQYYRLIITSQSAWLLVDHNGGNVTYLAGGPASNLNAQAGGKNEVMLVAKEARGQLYVNGEEIATFDLSSRQQSGRVGVSTGYWAIDGVDGVAIFYQDFMIRASGDEIADSLP